MGKVDPGSTSDAEEVPRLADHKRNSKMSIERNSKDLEFLVLRWSIETHTFVASWGEFGPTLEDVVALMSLPLFGDAQVTHFKFMDKDSKVRHDALTQFLQKTKYRASKKSTYLTWASYFVDGAGRDNPFQPQAFLAYWLSYFVFPGPPEDGVHSSVFSMAVMLA